MTLDLPGRVQSVLKQEMPGINMVTDESYVASAIVSHGQTIIICDRSKSRLRNRSLQAGCRGPSW